MPSEMNDENAILDASFHASPAPGFDEGSDSRVLVESWGMDIAYAESLLEIRGEGETTTLIYRALTPEQRALAARIRAAHTGNRWAAFTDDEIEAVAEGSDEFLMGEEQEHLIETFGRLVDDARAELGRRRSDG